MNTALLIVCVISVGGFVTITFGFSIIAAYKMGRKDEADEWERGTKTNDDDDDGEEWKRNRN